MCANYDIRQRECSTNQQPSLSPAPWEIQGIWKPYRAHVCLTVIIDLVSSVCVTEISEPAVDAPSFSLWFDDCRLLLQLLITSPTAFDLAEPHIGITAVRRVRRATASVKHPQECCCVAAIAANPSRKWPPQPRLLNVSNYWHWQIWWCCPVARVWISPCMTEWRQRSNVNSMWWK